MIAPAFEVYSSTTEDLREIEHVVCTFDAREALAEAGRAIAPLSDPRPGASVWIRSDQRIVFAVGAIATLVGPIVLPAGPIVPRFQGEQPTVVRR